MSVATPSPRPTLALVCLLLSGCTGNALGGGESTGEPEVSPPNVLLVVIDTLRADHLGCYGYQRPTSPNLDQLAAESFVFEQLYASGDSTRPSHVALFQSRAVHPGEMEPDEGVTVAEVFTTAGYRTYGISANPVLTRNGSWSRGFDYYTDSPFDPSLLEGYDPTTDFTRHMEVRSAEQTTNKVLEFLALHRESERAEPWFLFVNYLDPHDPYSARPPWSEEFRESTSTIGGALRTQDWKTLAPWLSEVSPRLAPDDIARLTELYDSEIRYTDEQLQRVFDELERSGQSQQTIIAVTSDHGELLGEHGLFTHGLNAYEAELHVPLILRVPGHEGGVRSSILCESPDVTATLVEVAGLAAPESFQGQTLLTPERAVRERFRTMTRHTHPVVLPGAEGMPNIPHETTMESIQLRFDGTKIYLFQGGAMQIFDIRDYPERRRIEDLDIAIPLVFGLPPRTPGSNTVLSDEAAEALRLLGYIE